MSSRPTVKKPARTVSSKAAESSKSQKPPTPRATAVQKLHVRLQQVSLSDNKRNRLVGVAANVAPHCAFTGSRPLGASTSDEVPPSRASSPGIEEVAPPGEPPGPAPAASRPRQPPVRRTAAQILRELARCRADQQAEIKRMSALEFAACPVEALNKASVELEEQQTRERAERRLLALLALDSAIDSKDRHLEDRKQLAAKALEERREVRQLLAELQQQQRQTAEQTRQSVHELRQRARQAVSDHVQQKSAEARSFGEEMVAIVQDAQKQKLEEREQRAELIQQIRQLQTSHVPPPKPVDLTATAGHRLLSEMSICELRERLALLRLHRQQQLREKNESIQQHKKQHEQQLHKAEQVLSRYHEIQHKQRQQRLQARAAGQQPAPVTSQRLQLLQAEYVEKRAERLRRAQRRRLRRLPQGYLLQAARLPAPPETRSAPAGMAQLQQPPPAAGRGGRRSRSDHCVQLSDQRRRLAEAPPQPRGAAQWV